MRSHRLLPLGRIFNKQTLKSSPTSCFPSRQFFWKDCQKLFSHRFNFSYQENVWPRSDSFIGRTKTYFDKYISWSWYSRCVWHMILLKHAFTAPKKAQETVRTDQTTSRWQMIQESKQREIELISKKVCRKRKKKLFKTRNWLLLHVKQYRNCCWRTYFIRKCTVYLHSAGQWSLIMMNIYLPSSTNKLVSTNQRAN